MCGHPVIEQKPESQIVKTTVIGDFTVSCGLRGGSRGRVQGVCTPPPLWDDLRFSYTTGILPKNKNYVVYWC